MYMYSVFKKIYVHIYTCRHVHIFVLSLYRCFRYLYHRFYGTHTLLCYCKRLFFLDSVKLSCKFVTDRLCNSFNTHYLQEIFLFILDSIFLLGNVGWTKAE